MIKLDPEAQQALLQMEQANIPPLDTLTAPQARDAFATLRSVVDNPTPVHSISDQIIPANTHSIPIRVYRNNDNSRQPALVWLHGGGWVLGNLDTADLPCRDLAKHSGCTVISVDYRLAPEAPFPAAFDDSLLATEWVIANSASLNIDPSRIAIGGDSAGANLAACAAIAARDKGLSLAQQLLIYPAIDAACDTPSYEENADGYFLTRTMMQWFWDQYMPSPLNRNDIRVAPLNADLTKLPPAWVLTAGFDPLRDDGVNYADSLIAAGVAVEKVHVADTIHGFFAMDLKGGAKARMAAAKALAATINP